MNGWFWFQLPQRTVDAIAIRQRLLAQYEQLQARLQELTEAASNEVLFVHELAISHPVGFF